MINTAPLIALVLLTLAAITHAVQAQNVKCDGTFFFLSTNPKQYLQSDIDYNLHSLPYPTCGISTTTTITSSNKCNAGNPNACGVWSGTFTTKVKDNCLCIKDAHSYPFGKEFVLYMTPT